MSSIQQHLHHPAVNSIKHSRTVLLCPAAEFVTVNMSTFITHLVKGIKGVNVLTKSTSRQDPSFLFEKLSYYKLNKALTLDINELTKNQQHINTD